MARRSRQTILKRQRELKKAEKAAAKRQRRADRRRPDGEGEAESGAGPEVGEPFTIEPLDDEIEQPVAVADDRQEHRDDS